MSEFLTIGGIQVKADVQGEGSERSHRWSEDSGWWEVGAALDGRDSGSLRWGLSCGHGEGAMERWEAEGQGSAEKCHPSSPPRQDPCQREVRRGRPLGVSTPGGGVVSRKHRGRALCGQQGTGSVKLGCIYLQVMYRESSRASEVWAARW